MSNDYDHDKLYNVLLYAQRGLVEMGELHARVLAYARPIVAEECAKIVDGLDPTEMADPGFAAWSIREHGKGKP